MRERSHGRHDISTETREFDERMIRDTAIDRIVTFSRVVTTRAEWRRFMREQIRPLDLRLQRWRRHPRRASPVGVSR